MTYQRDWLREAAEIAEGKSTVPLKREHIVSVYESYLKIAQKHAHLQGLLTRTLEEIQKQRIEAGLPAMPLRTEKCL